MSAVVGYLIGQVGEMSGLRVAVPDSGLIIGRDPKQAGLVVDHGLVSRRHAQIAIHTDGKLYLIDLQSRNGTFVNGHKLSAPVPLQTNDRIEFGAEGKVVFLYESADTTSVSGVLKEVFGETVAPVEWKVGDTILGIYEVTGILGQGGMGRVYKVHHRLWNMDLAVKSPLPGLFTEEKAVENFTREAETWVNLNLHPNIVQCFYVRTIGGIPRIFSEYVPGGTLHDWIKQRKLTQLDQILDVAIQFAWGLHAAHEQGIVHQDVKPLNVLMTPDGIAKVSDFGLARSRPVTGNKAATTPDNMVTMAGVFTKAYVSPEQAYGEKLSRKTDIWSWAVSVLHLFVGDIVWQNGLQAPEVLKAYRRVLGPKFIVKMPKDLARVLEACLAAQPNERPENMREVASTLENVYYSFRGQTYPRREPKPAEHLADSLNNRGVSLLDLGMEDKALALWEEAIKKEPHHQDATFNRALLQWRNGEISDDVVTARLSEMESSHPGSSYSKYLLALVHLERGACEEAIGVLRELSEDRELRDRFTPALGIAKSSLPSSVRQINKLSVREHRHVGKAMVLSPSGQTFALVTKDLTLPSGRVKVVNVQNGSESVQIKIDYATVAAFAAKEDILFVGDSGGWVSLFDLRDGRRLRANKFHSKAVVEIVTDLQGHTCASSSEDGTVVIWRIDDGTALAKLMAKQRLSICLFPDGERLAIGGEGGDISLFDVSRKTVLCNLQGRANAVTRLSVTADSRILVSAHDRMGLLVWDTAEKKCVRELPANTWRGFALSAGGETVVTLDGKYRQQLWDVTTGRCFCSFTACSCELFSITANGRYGLFGNEWGNFVLLHLPDDAPIRHAPFALARTRTTESSVEVEGKYREAISGAIVAYEAREWTQCASQLRSARSLPGCGRRPDAFQQWQSLYRCLPKRSLKGVWEAEDLKFDAWGVASGCSKDTEFILVGHDLSVKLRRMADDAEISEWPLEGAPQTLHLGKWGNSMVTKCDDHIQVRDIHTGAVLSEIESECWSWASSDDCRFILTSEWETLKLWDARVGRQLWSHKVDPVACLAFQPGADRILLGHSNGTLSELDIVTRACERHLDLGCGKVRSMLFLDNSPYLLTRAESKTDGDLFRLYVWDRLSGQQLCELDSSSHETNVACFVGGRRYLAVGGDSPVIDIFETQTWKLARSLVGHRAAVQSLAVSADGEKLFSTDAKWEGKVWLMDWELIQKPPTNWNEDVRPYLVAFLNIHSPCAGMPLLNHELTDAEIASALSRRSKPIWNEADYCQLLYLLRCDGYGWLSPEDVRSELAKMVAAWDSISHR
jgi:serine/threonine protein kinase